MCPLCFIGIKGVSEFRAFGYQSNIPGWTKSMELSWLYVVAQVMDSIVEIGSWVGRSTDALLSGCKGAVWTVDHFRGNGEHTKEQVKGIQKAFLRNVGHYKNLELLKMSSLEAVKKFENKSVDMVFIDGGHEYKEVMADIKAWLPKTKKLICGHDYGEGFKGVKRAVDEIFDDVNIFSSIWIKPIKEAS
jgi:predicted O-methyltransferase YrrM